MKRLWQNFGIVLVKSKDSLLAHLPKCTLFAPPPRHTPPKKIALALFSISLRTATQEK